MRSYLTTPFLIALLASAPALADATKRADGYNLPPPAVEAALRAPMPPEQVVNASGEKILLYTVERYPMMARVAEPFLRLAGLRVEPRTRRKHDTPAGYGINPCARELALVDVASATQRTIALPSGCTDRPLWSSDGKRFVFENASANAVELWIGDGATGAVHRLGNVRLNPMVGIDTVQWLPDGKSLLVKAVPANAGPAPAVNDIAAEAPSIQESLGAQGESSTYETRDTLTNKNSEQLFDYYATSQLMRVDAASGRATPLGKPAIYTHLPISPDGHLCVQWIHRPYSYVTTYNRFPSEVEIWDLKGAVVHKVASLPLFDRVPVHGVPTGPRDFEWRATEPATLVWLEALDGGDWNVSVPARDKLLMQRAPFTVAPVEVVRTEQRISPYERRNNNTDRRIDNLLWGEEKNLALIYEEDQNRHWRRIFTIDVDATQKPKLLFELSTDEHYDDPGKPVLRRLPTGQYVLRQDGNRIFFAGVGASPDGERPFLDALDLTTLHKERLFRSAKTAYESFIAFTDSPQSFLTWHETPTDPPNAFLHTLGAAANNSGKGEAQYTSTARAITQLPDPVPALRAIKSRLVKYKRKDGLELSFILCTPPGYTEGTRVPAILNAYPLDYADAKVAGQVTGSEQRFVRLDTYRLLLLAGYAIIDRAAFPVIGDPKRAYDHYVEQLVMDADAAVAKAVQLGVVDPDRIGVTGHSHGALMTVNLLAHSNLFRTGVATSGSYNKTLTPFGFQNERRSVWTAQNVYLQASPYFAAHTLKKPLLLMHGSEDPNPGTRPDQAVMLYEALRGNGGTVRLVMLPHEPHWYAALESNEQLIYEMIRWFDKYVKNAPAASSPAASSAPPAPAVRAN
jgi:dipeptidyl aminopeptidase/acylaminoacyl peptidase